MIGSRLQCTCQYQKRLCQSKCTGWTKARNGLNLGHAPSPKTRQPVSLFQLVIQGHPASRDDVRAVPAVASQRRIPVIRAGDQHIPQDGEILNQGGEAIVCLRPENSSINRSNVQNPMCEGSVGPICQYRVVPQGYGLDFQKFDGGGGAPLVRCRWWLGEQDPSLVAQRKI